MRFHRVVPFAVLAIVGSLVLVVPALGNSTEDAVRLHLGSDGRSFSYDGVTQTLSVARNGCQITSAEPLIDLSSTNGGTSLPGLNSLGIGVKSSGSNSNGTPCGQTDATETLSLAAQQGGTNPKLAGRSFASVRLDVEMTGNAVVKVNFFVGTSTTAAKTATLQTGTSIQPTQSDDPGYDTSAPYEVTTANSTSAANPEADPDLTDACAAPNSSGPNNGGNDNCLWTIDPGVTFSRISITTTVGTVSLEGSGDFGNDPAHDSLFYLANAVPTADDDTYTTNEDTTLNVSAPGVLDGDADADGDSLSAVLVDDVANGTLSLDSNGSFSYAPSPENWNGTDSFTYRASDGTASSDVATVTINVASVNDAPVGAGPATAQEDATTTVTVATDVDDTVINSSCTSSQGGTVVDNGDGTVTYTPPADFSGTDTLVCSVNDGEATVSIDVSVSVTGQNDAPVATDDEGFVDAGASVSIDVLGNDTDVDGGTLTVSAVTQGASGSVTDNGNGSVTYDADADFEGTDTFTYTVSDGELTDTGTVTVYELFECGETLTVTEGDTSAAYQRLPEQEGCGEGKPYFVDIVTTTQGTTQLPTVVFQPRSQTGDAVEDCSATPELCLDEFAATITFGPRPEANAPDTGTLHYDPVNREPSEYETEGDFRDMEWCEIEDFDPYAPGRPASSEILPSGESWCIASVGTSSSSDSETLTTWVLYGIGDPAKRL